MSNKTYYEILGVSQKATADEIRKAYKIQARVWHPNFHVMEPEEKQKYAEEMMQIINEAYSVLSNQSKKNDYDLRLRQHGNFSTTQDHRTNHSYTDVNKQADSNLDEELEDLLTSFREDNCSIIENLKRMCNILILCQKKPFLTEKQLELINELIKILKSFGIEVPNDVKDSSSDGAKTLKF